MGWDGGRAGTRFKIPGKQISNENFGQGFYVASYLSFFQRIFQGGALHITC